MLPPVPPPGREMVPGQGGGPRQFPPGHLVPADLLARLLGIHPFGETHLPTRQPQFGQQLQDGPVGENAQLGWAQPPSPAQHQQIGFGQGSFQGQPFQGQPFQQQGDPEFLSLITQLLSRQSRPTT